LKASQIVENELLQIEELEAKVAPGHLGGSVGSAEVEVWVIKPCTIVWDETL
jgi:hypothetical protein